MNKIITTERGWPGHFIGASECLFRRNTLVQYGEKFIVVSTVGNYRRVGQGKVDAIGYDRYYETMAFRSDESDETYHDINVSEQVYPPEDIKWAINKKEINTHEKEIDNLANKMHEDYVLAISKMLRKGEL